MNAEKSISQIILKKLKSNNEPPKLFTFDAVFGVETSQRSIYNESAFSLIESVIEGYNG